MRCVRRLAERSFASYIQRAASEGPEALRPGGDSEPCGALLASRMGSGVRFVSL